MDFTIDVILRHSQSIPRNVDGDGLNEDKYLLLGSTRQDSVEADLTTSNCGIGVRRQGFRLFETD